MAMLEPDDVLEDESVDDDVFGHQRPQDLVYPVEMAKLARLRVFLTISYSVKECLLICWQCERLSQRSTSTTKSQISQRGTP